ncbi:tripartite tricarboxylate transporter TctB family protein [Paracoccus onubensis]|uniref:Tripartite tricarboxylate transporter TctB family protein n=1 Tax=Paracoccus onubensis TaxID=1675788 RepID=A0A418T270_9RHOB|nr:tripartite tricarboxylate transporter TctB family protein [Paracoccus onubensis]RJE87220.1 tripartite tricarboxylate transporter TctB family protein [Paracoccus onubensis]
MTMSRISASLLAMVGLVAAAMAWRLGIWTSGQPGPGLFPFATGILLSATAIFSAIQTRNPEDGDGPVDFRRLGQYAVAIIGFGIAMKPLGTLIATFGLIGGVLRFIEDRSRGHAFAVAVVLAGLSWGIFRYLLGVPLPPGFMEIQ